MRYILLFLYMLFSAVMGSAQTLDNLNRQINELLQQGDHVKALPLAEKAAGLAKAKFGEHSAPYAQNLFILANVYNKNRPKSNPETLYLRALEIIRAVNPDTQIVHIPYLLGLAAYYVDTRQFEKAEPLYPVAANILDRAGLENSSLYSVLLSGRGNLLYQQGLYTEAEPLFIKAIDIEKKGNRVSSRDYAIYTGMLGDIYTREGNFDKAEPLLTESMELRKILYGDQHLEYGNAVLRLAEFYGELRQFQKGLGLFTQAIGILGKALGRDHPDFAILMTKAGAYAYAAGDLNNAQILYQFSLNLIKKAFGDQSKEYGSVLNGLALVMLKNKEYTAAEPLFKQAMEISKKLSGENDLDFASSLNNLGLLYSGMGLYEKSLPFYIQALEILDTRNAGNNPDYLFCLTNLAQAYVNTGQYDKAEPLVISAASQSVQNLRNTFSILSENEKNNYLENTNWLEQMNNSFLFNNKAYAKNLALSNFNFQLFAKSLALTDTRSMMELAGSSNDSVLKRLFTEWKFNRTLLARQYALPAGKRISNLAVVEAKTEQLEKELTRNFAAFRNQQDELLLSIKDVQSALQPDEAAIAFVRFSLYNREWTDSVVYAAYILRKEDSLPQFVPLCEEKQLGKYLSAGAGETTIRAIYRSDPLDENDKPSISGDSLYTLVWKPMMPWLKGIHKINYSPAGLFYKIAFHALPAGDSLLLMDRFELNQYTSIRQLALNREKPVSNPSIGLFGDCVYDADSAELVRNILPGEKGDQLTAIPAGQGEYKGGWRALDGTAREISGIQALFEAKKMNSTSYSQLKSTEEQFKALSGNTPAILHLATHGFFLQDPQTRLEEGLGADNRNAFTQANDPLLRSGIVLSGANRVWNGLAPLAGVEDGIVTAYEIAQLDFRQTDLVVLSACQTALGDVKGTEGVFGLQRAFKLAGVKKMLLSLWKIPDAETAELMNIFYTNYLQGKSARESFSAAQKEMRRKYKPFYWAAFVLVE
jgi:CHAT domain-containing protein